MRNIFYHSLNYAVYPVFFDEITIFLYWLNNSLVSQAHQSEQFIWSYREKQYYLIWRKGWLADEREEDLGTVHIWQ